MLDAELPQWLASLDILPAQFFARRVRMDPAYQLWAEVMKVAIKDAGSRNPKRRAEVAAWVNDCGHYVGSFGWVCEVLELDAERARTKLLVWLSAASSPFIPRTAISRHTRPITVRPPRLRHAEVKAQARSGRRVAAAACGAARPSGR